MNRRNFFQTILAGVAACFLPKREKKKELTEKVLKEAVDEMSKQPQQDIGFWDTVVDVDNPNYKPAPGDYYYEFHDGCFYVYLDIKKGWVKCSEVWINT